MIKYVCLQPYGNSDLRRCPPGTLAVCVVRLLGDAEIQDEPINWDLLEGWVELCS